MSVVTNKKPKLIDLLSNIKSKVNIFIKNKKPKILK